MLNCVTLMGRLTADPEVRTTTTGKSVCTFSIAVDRSFARAGEQRQTDFINIVAWEGSAKFVSNYFAKGSMIAIQGSIQTRNYEDKNGNKRTAFEVIAKEISFCGGKNENSPAPTPTAATPSPNINVTADDFEAIEDDDELPF